MTSSLEKLADVREAGLQGLRGELTRRLDELAAIDRELSAVEGQLREIDAQHAAWELEWQHWMSEDGVLSRGQGYNAHHVILNAWREDVVSQRMEIVKRRQAAQEQVTQARSRLLQAQQRVELIKREVASEKKSRRRRRLNRMETNAMDDMTHRGREANSASE